MHKWCQVVRALALLGVLTIYLALWPMLCCAAKPVTPPTIGHLATEAATTAADVTEADFNDKLLNQTYQDLMTAKFSDNIMKLGTNHNFDKFDTPTASNISDKMTLPDDVNAQSTQPMQSSIYEVFELSEAPPAARKVKRGDQILSRTERSISRNGNNSNANGAKRVRSGGNKTKTTLERNERSANLSHITGSARKIQLYIKNRFLQLLPDGTINGTTDDQSDFSKFAIFMAH